MDVTTLDRLRAWFHDQPLKETSLIMQLVGGLSSSIEGYLGRYLQAAERTTYIDVTQGDRVFFLRGYPITAIAVYEDSQRTFAGSATSTSLYDRTARAWNEGRLEFDFDPTVGPSTLKVVYTGGMALTTAALIADHLGLVQKLEEQIVYAYRTQGILGLDSSGGGQLGESIRRQVNMTDWWQAHGEFSPDVQRVLRTYKSYVQRW